jgi:hypothetical protein
MNEQPDVNADKRVDINLSKSYNVENVTSSNIAVGENNSIVTPEMTNYSDVALEFEAIFNRLVQRYVEASEHQKQIIFQTELRQTFKTNPSLRTRSLSALKAGSLELVKVLTENPFVSVSVETVRGWLEA